MNKKIMSIALTGLLGVTLLSVGLVKNNVFAATSDNKIKTEVSGEQKDDSNLRNIEVKLTKDEVTKLALNKYKSGTVQEINLEEEDGKLVYEVEMIVDGIEHDIDIDANSGNILEDEVDDHDLEEASEEADDNEEDNLKQLTKITADQAITIVSNKYKDGIIAEVELENENGNIVYEVEVNAKDGVHDIKIDAENGNILIDEIDE